MENSDDTAILEVSSSSEGRIPENVNNGSRNSITDVSNISTSIDESMVPFYVY